MAKKTTKKSEVQANLSQVEEEAPSLPTIPTTSFEQLQNEAMPSGEERFGPPMWSDRWQDFVMGQLADDEKDKEGHPMVHGLRRLARKLLGVIVYSGPEETPRVDYIGLPNETEYHTRLKPVCVRYKIRILWTRPEDTAGGPAFPVEFCDVADVMLGNTAPEFLVHASATASTKAEARCLRKALQLKKVSADEKTTEQDADAVTQGLIRDSEITFIDVLCSRLDINVMKFINSGELKYDNIRRVPLGRAKKMLEQLDRFQKDTKKIKNDFLGYDSNWREQGY